MRAMGVPFLAATGRESAMDSARAFLCSTAMKTNRLRHTCSTELSSSRPSECSLANSKYSRISQYVVEKTQRVPKQAHP